jgi:N-methylhydantoinase A
VANMRYAEQQLQALPVPLSEGPVDEAACARLLAGFDREYERQFGPFAKALFQAVEVFAVRVEARVPAQVGDVTPAARPEPAPASGRREVHWPGHGPRPTSIYDGAALGGGQRVDGPAVVELAHTTVPVAPGQHLVRDAATDNLLLRLEA